ncbi:MAG: metallophosphoesterase [Gemmatimonadaceae bacterium]
MNFVLSGIRFPALAFLVSILPACAGDSRAEERTPGNVGSQAKPNSTAADPTIVGAGDIASCQSSGDERTADLLDHIPGQIFTVGDNAYESEDAEKPFEQCYEPSWGRHRSRTRPVPGNHEYDDGYVDAYFDYFGRAAGERRKGYYSYTVGAWHVIALNSMLDAGPDSPQGRWLADDLAKNRTHCAVAYYHYPRYSSGPHSRRQSAIDMWNVLSDAGVDVVVNGHDHIYERFGPMTKNGERDNENGMREFVVGTGGASHYDIEEVKAHSEVRNDDTYGVLLLTLHHDSYDWRFIPVRGRTFSDSGSNQCH